MPFEIVRNDIANMQADAIVNTADPFPVVGPGTDESIHRKAGPELLEARRKIGNIQPGCAVITPAFSLDAKYVIHTVGPRWEGGNRDEERVLRSCYINSLELALQAGCQSIAFPLIATGHFGFPKDRALQIAISVFTRFLTEYDLQIWLVVFDRGSFKLSEKLFSHVASFIDAHYADTVCFKAAAERRPQKARNCAAPDQLPPYPSMAAPASASLADILRQQDAGFTERLLQLIDRSGKKDAEVYKKANISKQHFSKIRNNPHYKPTKATAIALAIALELDLEETKDLIGRAGFALTNSSKFDLIIRYFVELGNYNIVEINIALYEFDQPLLGA